MKAIMPAAVLFASLAVWGCGETIGNGTNPHLDISAVFQQACSECHQPQRVASVSFASLSEASVLVRHMITDHGANVDDALEEPLCRYIYQLCFGDDEITGEW